MEKKQIAYYYNTGAVQVLEIRRVCFRQICQKPLPRRISGAAVATPLALR